MADLIQGLRARLGIQADAELDDDGLLAALDEALAEQAEDTVTPPPAAQASATVPEGTVLVEQTQFEELKASAALGVAAHTRQVQEDRLTLVNNAIAKGKIPPARKQHWLDQLDADEEGAKATLAALAEGTIPLELIGHTGGVDAAGDESAYPSNWLPNRQRS